VTGWHGSAQRQSREMTRGDRCLAARPGAQYPHARTATRLAMAQVAAEVDAPCSALAVLQSALLLSGRPEHVVAAMGRHPVGLSTPCVCVVDQVLEQIQRYKMPIVRLDKENRETGVKSTGFGLRSSTALSTEHPFPSSRISRSAGRLLRFTSSDLVVEVVSPESRRLRHANQAGRL
jgi:hypothetical protein